METFSKEVAFLTPVYDQVAHDAGNIGVWGKGTVKKIATFKELDQTDRDQHKFHFKVISFFGKSAAEETDEEEEKESVGAFDSDGIYDIATKFIKKFLVPGPDFTLADRESFLSDSGALLDFSLWLVKDKLTPFFLKLRGKPNA